MIGRIHGVLLEANPPELLIDVHGVGYEVSVPMSTYYDLPPIGSEVTLFTHFVVREDAMLLYGFATKNERIAFRALLRISGVGPRIALAVLSGLTPAQLAQAIENNEVGLLTRVPGIGKKTAERITLELQGKLSNIQVRSTPLARGDIIRALLALGYADREANKVVKTLPADVSVTEGIRLALKALAR